MENRGFEKGKKLAKAAALASALTFSPESAAQQTNGNWDIVTKAEFYRHNIPGDSIQTIMLGVSEHDEMDNSKRGVLFIDKGGHQIHYWINKAPCTESLHSNEDEHDNFSREDRDSETQKPDEEVNFEDNSGIQVDRPDTTAEQLTEEEKEIKEIIENPEIKNALESFRNKFKLKEPWAIDPTTGKEYEISGEWEYKNPPEELKDLGYAVILIDSLGEKQVAVIGGVTDDFLTFLRSLQYRSNIEGLKDYIRNSLQLQYIAPTRQEKIDYIKSLIVDEINRKLKELPQYEPPVIKEPEYKPHDYGTGSPGGVTKPDLPAGEKPKGNNVTIGKDDVENALDAKP